MFVGFRVLGLRISGPEERVSRWIGEFYGVGNSWKGLFGEFRILLKGMLFDLKAIPSSFNHMVRGPLNSEVMFLSMILKTLPCLIEGTFLV